MSDIDVVDFMSKISKSNLEINGGNYSSYETQFVELKFNKNEKMFILISIKENKLDALTNRIHQNLSDLSKNALNYTEGLENIKELNNSLAYEFIHTKNKVKSFSVTLHDNEIKNINLHVIHSLDSTIKDQTEIYSFLSSYACAIIHNNNLRKEISSPKFIKKNYRRYVSWMDKLSDENLVNINES
jgi:hypothetical protein